MLSASALPPAALADELQPLREELLAIRVGWLAIAAAIIVPFAILRWRAARKVRTDHAGHRADALAQGMGLSVVDGDPTLNLMLAHHEHTQKSRKRTHVTLHGTPAGRATTFVYDFDNRAGTFRCRLSVQGPQAFPAFEVTLRHPARYHEPDRELPFAPVAVGDPVLDARFDVRAEHFGVGPALVPMLSAMSDWTHVHVVGAGGALHWTATRTASSTAIFYLPQVHPLLVDAFARLAQIDPARFR